MSNKDIDGIKKISKEEMKEARKILLDYIGEDSQKTEKKEAKENKNIDGILGRVNFKKKKKVTNTDDKKLENIDNDSVKNELGIEDEKKEVKADIKIGGAFSRMAETKKKKEERKKELEEIKKKQEEEDEREKEKQEKEKKEKEKNLIRNKEKEEKSEKEDEENAKKLKAEKIKKEEAEKKKRHMEKIQKEKEEAEKRRKIEQKILEKKKKEEEKKERKKKIKKKIKLYKHLFHIRVRAFLSEIKKRKKKIILKVIFLVLVVFLFYLMFLVFLIKVQPKNDATRYITNIVPAPVVFSSLGVLEYFEYQDKKTEYLNGPYSADEADFKKFLALDLVYSSLVGKYNLSLSDENFEKKMKRSILLDMDINSVGIKRIEKIKELIDKGGNFVQVSGRFGDKVNQIDFKDEAEAVSVFGPKLFELRIDEVSDIVVHSDGYYIFKRYKKNDLFSLSYVFISSVSLDEYLNNKAREAKIWSLLN